MSLSLSWKKYGGLWSVFDFNSSGSGSDLVSRNLSGFIHLEMVLPFSMVKEEPDQLYFELCWVVGQQLDPIQTPSHLMEQLLTSENICHIFNHLVSALCPLEVACWSDSGPWPCWSCQAWVSSNLSPVPRGEGGKPQRLRWQREQKQKLCFPNPLIWTGHHQSSQPMRQLIK